MSGSEKLTAVVCSSCGKEVCAAGNMFCEDYRTADMIPRWRWERFEAVGRLAMLAPTVAQDGTLLHAVRVAESLAKEQTDAYATLEVQFLALTDAHAALVDEVAALAVEAAQ